MIRKLFSGYSINFNDKEQFDFARSYVLYVIRHKKIDSYANRVNSSSRISSTLLSFFTVLSISFPIVILVYFINESNFYLFRFTLCYLFIIILFFLFMHRTQYFYKQSVKVVFKTLLSFYDQI